MKKKQSSCCVRIRKRSEREGEDEMLSSSTITTKVSSCSLCWRESERIGLDEEYENRYKKNAPYFCVAQRLVIALITSILILLLEDCDGFAIGNDNKKQNNADISMARMQRQGNHLLLRALKESLEASYDSPCNEDVTEAKKSRQASFSKNDTRNDKKLRNTTKKAGSSQQQQQSLLGSTNNNTNRRLDLTGTIMDAIRSKGSFARKEDENLTPPATSSSQSTEAETKAVGSSSNTSSCGGLFPETAQATASMIHATIADMMAKQLKRVEDATRQEDEVSAPVVEVANDHRQESSTMGILGSISWDTDQPTKTKTRPVSSDLGYASMIPDPGKTLVPPTDNSPVIVKVATPIDDVDIANLRLSVFSDFSPDIRQQFCSRSCKAIKNRRSRGASCVVATTKGTSDEEDTRVVLGSAECSFHEFFGTELGRMRSPDTMLYVTEVAVSPLARRRGIGSKLMKAIDILASIRNIETIFLHVDVTNDIAYSLYEKAGYNRIKALSSNSSTGDDSNSCMFYEFTKSLNLHDGATKGRNHFLMYKDIVTTTASFEKGSAVIAKSTTREVSSPSQPKATIGFEIPNDVVGVR